MAYRAYIESVRDNSVPSENIWIAVRFEDAASSPPRSFTKEYKYVVGTLRADFEAMVLADRQALRALDSVKTLLIGAIGQEVT